MTFIFDFDGTIVDSFDYVLGFLSREAKREKPEGHDADQYRGKSMKDMALELGVAWWKLPNLYFKGRRVMRTHMDNLHAFIGMEEVIKTLHDDGHELFIVSSNSGRNIRHFLDKYELKPYFRAIRSSAGLFGKDNLIAELKTHYKLKGDIWYIGDETTDIRAAKAARIKIAAVAWGFASQEELVSKEPDALILLPPELLKLAGPTP
jgi:phosphoglycolate phosphatase